MFITVYYLSFGKNFKQAAKIALKDHNVFRDIAFLDNDYVNLRWETDSAFTAWMQNFNCFYQQNFVDKKI